jgi:hypothetical protein
MVRAGIFVESAMPLRRPLADDANHWRLRAEQARAIAYSLSDPVACEQMLSVAASYHRIAYRAYQNNLPQVDAAE